MDCSWSPLTVHRACSGRRSLVTSPPSISAATDCRARTTKTSFRLPHKPPPTRGTILSPGRRRPLPSAAAAPVGSRRPDFATGANGVSSAWDAAGAAFQPQFPQTSTVSPAKTASLAAAGGAAIHSVNRANHPLLSSSDPAAPGQTQQKRWVPNFANRQRDEQALAQTSKNDAIFRRVRGILNKLTPEKFEKLTADILNGLDSIVVLKGVILLIFEKALDEPKYSSMYAQLCKRLADNAPNFEPPGQDGSPQTTTFRRLLLAKCRDEFENRSQIAQQFEKMVAAQQGGGGGGGGGSPKGGANAKPGGNLDPDETIDARTLAKRKMLGNIKFIGELGKLQIVHDSILHRCCEQLLVGRRRQPIPDQAEDLECLCHLMRTCGRILDTPKAKVRMDQYFDRLKPITTNESYPVRIRFLVQDIIEMRRNRWMPRKIGKAPEGPRTIQQVREDAYRDGCIYMPQQGSPPQHGKGSGGGMMGGMGQGFLNPLEGNFFDGKPRGSGKKGQDFFGGYGGGAGSYLGMGPGVIHAEAFEEPKDAPPFEVSGQRNAAMNNGYHKNGGGGGEGRGNNFGKHGPRHDVDEKGDGVGKNENDRGGYYNDRNQDYDNNRRGGGGGGRDGSYNHFTRAPDFGDRYSANRSKDRDRRQQFQGPPQQQQPRGGDRFNDNNRGDRFNDNNRGGKFGDQRYESKGFGSRNGGGPPRDGIMRSDGGNYHNDDDSGNLPPRFKRMQVGNQQQQQQQGYNRGPGNHNSYGGPPAGVSGPDGGQISPPPSNNRNNMDVVSLRPQSASNMLFKPKTPSMLPKSAIRGQESSPLGENSLLGPPLPTAPAKVMMQQKEAPIVIKQGSLDKGKKDKNKGNKGPTRDEVFARMEAILSELAEHKSAPTAAESWRENNWLPSKMSQTAATHFLKAGLCRAEKEERELALQLLALLVKEGPLNATHCQEALSKIAASHLAELDKAHEKEENGGKRMLAEAGAWLVREELLTFKELGELVRGEQAHPAFLIALAELKESWGEEKLKKAFDDAKMSAVDFEMDAKQTSAEEKEEALLAALDAHGLSFLLPLLSVRREMSRRLADDSDPASFAKWLQESEALSGFHARPEFVTALFKIVLGHVTSKTTLTDGASTTQQPDKSSTEAERELLDSFRPVLQPFVQNKPELQLAAVYALQVFCFEQDYPKGLLLRSFVNCYELDVMDEQAFLKWKEDVNDAYPGKGKALFQVNQWLTWLEEAESEEEDEDDE